jgi:hypothetical protein
MLRTVGGQLLAYMPALGHQHMFGCLNQYTCVYICIHSMYMYVRTVEGQLPVYMPALGHQHIFGA